MVEVRLLGPLTVVRDGTERAVPVGRPRAVAARLALAGGDAITTSQIIEDIWGEEPPPTAANALQVAISSLRKVLGSDAVLTLPGAYALRRDVFVDVREFETEARVGLEAAERGDDVAALAALSSAVDRWASPLIDVEAVFVGMARDSLVERYLVAAEAQAATLTRLGQADRALLRLPDLVSAHPFREGLVAQLVIALAACGRQVDALGAYESARQRLDDEFGVDPGTQLKAAQERVLREDLPPQGASTGIALRLGLHVVPPELVGRQRDLESVRARLDEPSTRLVNVIGPPGIGKTRLAQAVVQARPDSSAFASLSPSGGPIAGQVQRQLVPGDSADPESTVVDVLRVRRAPLLLVLDDVEPGEEASSFITTLLTAVPTLTVLVTSRGPLRWSSEVRYPLPPLSTTAVGEALPEATRLLLQRLSAVDARFRPEAADLQVIDEIATLCDGLPLALDLAAARASTLALADLLERMRTSFAVLRRRAVAGERWSSVTAAVEWSLSELEPQAVTVIEALSVFRAAPTLEAVGVVAGLPDDDVDDEITELVERGLVESSVPDGHRRFRLLRPVREAVWSKVAEPDQHRLRSAHREWHRRQWCDHDWYVRSPASFARLRTFEAERDDMRAAVEHAEVFDGSLFARMVGRLGWACAVAGESRSWLAWRNRALERSDLDVGTRFDLIVAIDATPSELSEAAHLLNQLDDRERTRFLLFRRIRKRVDAGDLPGARELLQQWGDDPISPPFIRARFLDAQQMVASLEGDSAAALEPLATAERLARTTGAELDLVLLQRVRAEVLLAGGDWDAAAKVALEVLTGSEVSGAWLRGAMLSVQGVALTRLGRVDAGLDLQRTALSLLAGSPWEIDRIRALVRWEAAAVAVDGEKARHVDERSVWRGAMSALGLELGAIERDLNDMYLAHRGRPVLAPLEPEDVRATVDRAIAAVLDGP